MNTSRKIHLHTPLQYLKGVGPKRAKTLAKIELLHVFDALYYFPFRYEDRRKVFSPSQLAQVREGSLVSIQGKIDKIRSFYTAKRKKMLELTIIDRDGVTAQCIWFHSSASMQKSFEEMQSATFTGKLYAKHPHFQLVHPDVDKSSKKTSIHWGRIVPIYPSTEGLNQKLLRSILYDAQSAGLELLEDPLPLSLRKRYNFPSLSEAIAKLHYPSEVPETSQKPSPSLERLIFEEFFQFQFFLFREQSFLAKNKAHPLPKKYTMPHISLPFTLSQSQEKAIEEILGDMKKDKPMHRILQGEVGCGKTIVALVSLLSSIENGHQGVLMVPTETLAEQHYNTIGHLLKDKPLRKALLTGSTKKKEKEKIYQDIEDGNIQLVVGTHALIQEKLSFHSLGLVVIDEQHRFGVRQRNILRNKGDKRYFPHLLTMTATPIPRSLALTYFGELSITTIEEVPPGRLPIKTKIIHTKERQKLYNLFKKEAALGNQSYLVYPLIEESEKEGMQKVLSVEKEFERLGKGALKELRIEILHSKTPLEKQREVMQAFLQRKLDVLISTTIIEVGIDVSNATVMAVENAERFGLSQLHQLRGRVGRSEKQSYCVLVTDARSSQKEKKLEYSFSDSQDSPDYRESYKRLKVIEDSQSGFLVAEEDLKIRGPGEFLGTRQSGLPVFHLADLKRDEGILENARKEASALWKKDPELRFPEHQKLKEHYDQHLSFREKFLHSG